MKVLEKLENRATILAVAERNGEAVVLCVWKTFRDNGNDPEYVVWNVLNPSEYSGCVSGCYYPNIIGAVKEYELRVRQSIK